MKVRVNGRPEEIAAGTTVAEYVRCRGLDPQRVAAEVNGRIVKREAFEVTVLEENDTVEIVHFVGGG